MLATLVIRINPPPLLPLLGYVYLIGLLSFVAAVTVAILHYGLYDIDFSIGRTLAHGALVICITLIYIGVVVGLARSRIQPANRICSCRW